MGVLTDDRPDLAGELGIFAHMIRQAIRDYCVVPKGCDGKEMPNEMTLAEKFLFEESGLEGWIKMLGLNLNIAYIRRKAIEEKFEKTLDEQYIEC